MRMSVSNIAWNHDERLAAYAVLQAAGVSGLEIAPGLFFCGQDDCFAPSDQAVRQAMAELDAAGLTLTSMQSLLFGVQGAALFGLPDERARFDQAMRRAITLAGRLGIANLVFGAPRQRIIPQRMSLAEATDLALAQFRQLGEVALASGTAISIEANPAAYGTNFLNRTVEAQAFVDALNHAGITLILDTGTVAMNGETVDVTALVPTLGHVHLSEPNLSPAPADVARTAEILKALADAAYRGAVSIEMKRDDTGLAAVLAAVDRLTKARDLAGMAQ